MPVLPFLNATNWKFTYILNFLSVSEKPLRHPVIKLTAKLDFLPATPVSSWHAGNDNYSFSLRPIKQRIRADWTVWHRVSLTAEAIFPPQSHLSFEIPKTFSLFSPIVQGNVFYSNEVQRFSESHTIRLFMNGSRKCQNWNALSQVTCNFLF